MTVAELAEHAADDRDRDHQGADEARHHGQHQPADRLRHRREVATALGWETNEDVPEIVQRPMPTSRAGALEAINDPDAVTRPPVVTIMGHVDHGKTKLLDAIR